MDYVGSQNFLLRKTSSITARTLWTLSSPICTKTEPESDSKIAGHGEAIPQVGEVGVYAVPPCVPESLDLLRLPGHVRTVAVPHVTARGGPLEV